MCKLLWQAYYQPSKLIFGEYFLDSSEGVQQEDPFGPTFFALSVDPIPKDMHSKLNVWYPDDACILGDWDTVLIYLENMVTKHAELGLSVVSNKCGRLLEHCELEAAVATEMVIPILPGVENILF